jgi:16S rRNA (guanine(966)-N(2))-methyltransferase RsmD
MRVIAGSLKGRRLKAPDWPGLRPTADKQRETHFNVLAPRIEGARVADLYAGTGAVGIEALSRGAREVTFVDSDRRAQALIAANLAHCGIATSYTIVRGRAERAFGSLDKDVGFDIVLLDPPYSINDADLAVALAAVGERLAAGGVAVLEHATRRRVPDVAGRLVRSRDVMAGDSTLTFYVFGSRAATF